MGISRVWLFRGFIVVCALLVLISWNMPWWTANIYEISPEAVQIRPWGLENNVGAEYGPLISKANMPPWFAPFMWSFLAILLISLALSLVAPEVLVNLGPLNIIVPKWVQRRALPSWLCGGVGIAYCVCVLVMAIYASQRTPEFWDTPFIGTTHISLGDSYNSDVTTSLQPGYFLAWGVGIALTVMAIYRHKFLGIPLLTEPAKAGKPDRLATQTPATKSP